MPINRTGVGVIRNTAKWFFNKATTIFKDATAGGSLRDPAKLKMLAGNTLKLYGGATLATYGARMVAGRSPFRSGSGKRNVLPGLPF